ncbi:BTB/POZ domain-containing protein 9 [Nymphon striatum]|nr:BTB/POZ domain-containing protein 9 [Nymphon striatum]
MSDNRHLGQNHSSTSELDHTSQLSRDIGQLFLNKQYSDVILVVEDIEFSAHKVILAARSEYFRALLYGGMRESQQSRIVLQVTNLKAFEYLLNYIYTGNLALARLKEDVILDILGHAHHYAIIDLQMAISVYLEAILNITNVCMIYDMANLYQLTSLVEVCSLFMDRHASEIIQHGSFLSLSASALKNMISRDSFCAPEVEIFSAVCEWSRHNITADTDRKEELHFILQEIRLPLMSLQDLLNVVRPSCLMSPDTILDAIKSRTECRDVDLKYRGYLMPEENIASVKHGADVIAGEMRSALLDEDMENYDMEKGFTRHPIDDNNGQGILIKLGMQCIINHIKMLLWDRDTRSYSYYIEVSMDMKDWVRVIDHTQYLCRSWQRLYFPVRVARYIRITGTHNTVNRVFHLVSFSCMFTNTKFTLDPSGIIGGNVRKIETTSNSAFICTTHIRLSQLPGHTQDIKALDFIHIFNMFFSVPTKNVAHISESANVIEGVSRSRNALLNGDTEKYDWDSGYTCHQLGSGAIVIQLAQPYVISSISYSYYIEVSLDQSHWELVVDKSKESCRSWQTLTFDKKAVTFIRIVGSRNSANEVNCNIFLYLYYIEDCVCAVCL